MEKQELLILGGDRRQYYMSQYLLSQGYPVTVYGENFREDHTGMSYVTSVEAVYEYLAEAHPVVILPVPVTLDGKTVKGTGEALKLSKICPYVEAHRRLYGGSIPQDFRSQCEMKQGQCVDLMQSERVAYLNAVSTAEGSIAEAMVSGATQLSGSKSLVLGFGRCGAVLADKLRCLGADVTVMERTEKSRARAAAYGLGCTDFTKTGFAWGAYEYIFNTVPAPVLSETELRQCSKAVTIIDLASKPGGVDYAAAEQLGIQAKLCPGLPGKYAPKTAGEILAKELVYFIEKDAFAQKQTGKESL